MADKKPAGRFRKWTRRLLKGGLVALVLTWVGYHLLSWIFPFPHDLLDRAKRSRISTAVLDREGQLLRAFTGPSDTWMYWVPLDRIHPALIEATVAVEDERFYLHPGVDPLSVVRAAGTNLAHFRTVSGASTIPMQVMRLLEDRPRRLDSKIVESFRALQLDGLITKSEIMEWYLNLAPYGGNFIGVEAAALGYFQKHACDLTLSEAALLAGLPQAPSRLRPDRFPDEARARRDHVLERMRGCGTITEEQHRQAQKELVTVHRSSPNLDAPHWTQMLIDRYPGVPVLRSTLDRRMQHISETALRDAVSSLRTSGITNGAVVVIENSTSSVRALVGSCDFFNEAAHGQVNGATALRSPGSALKPFTYALALERGLCTPGTILADVPIQFENYGPENYDHRYRGPVTAREALSTSLNVPAVQLLNDLSPESLHRFLKQTGFTSLTKSPGHYGLAMTLGSGEISLLELTLGYSTLARLGVSKPLRLLEDTPVPADRRVLSEGAAYLIADMLSDTSRLNSRPLWKSDKSRIRMAWKTGTSYGHRDAWMVAYTPEYTVGVWMGNFSGKPSRALVGIHAAAPVAARIMDLLYGEKSPTWYAVPGDVAFREVCADSGMPAGEFCPARMIDVAIHGRSSAQPCTVHRQVKIDSQTKTMLCPLCSPDRTFTEVVAESWPEPLSGWFRSHGRPQVQAPPHYPGCSRAAHEGATPKILSPTPGQTYLILSDGETTHQKVLLKAAASGEKHYWFVDGTWYANADPGEPLFWPLSRGRHTVTCSDASGRASAVTIEVK